MSLRVQKRQNKEALIDRSIRSLQWLFGWLPRSMIKRFEYIEYLFQEEDSLGDEAEIEMTNI